MSKVVKNLEKRMNEMEDELRKMKRAQKKETTKDRPKKPPSEYNLFVKKNIAEQKKVNEKEGKTVDHKILFSNAVKAWGEQKK